VWYSLVNVLLPAAISGFAGVCAWIVTNFFAEPLLEFRKLRKAVHESLFFNANVGSISREISIETASIDLRKFAAALNAFWVTAPAIVKNYLSRSGYNVEAASFNLVGFSNSIHLEEGSRAIHRHRIEKGLRLPMSYSDEEIRSVIEENRRRHSRG
jgi:hypothetical protein